MTETTNIFATMTISYVGVSPGPWGCEQFGMTVDGVLRVGGTTWAQSRLMEYGMDFHAAKDLVTHVADSGESYAVCNGLPWAL